MFELTRERADRAALDGDVKSWYTLLESEGPAHREQEGYGMIRKIGILIAALMAAAQVCLAAADIDSVDFSGVKAYERADSLVADIRESVARVEPQFAAVLADAALMDAADGALTSLGQGYRSQYTTYDDGRIEVLYAFDHPIGARALRAHRTGDFDALDERGTTIHRVAQAVVEHVVGEDMSPLEREIALHDYLTEHVEYDLSGGDDAYAALVGGRAVCSGYADAFLLLGGLAGLNVRTVSGVADIPHQWNAVELDGLWYFVDVTWDDPVGGRPCRAYLNAVPDMLAATHSWEEANQPEPMARALDDRYYYRWSGQFAAGAAEFEEMARALIDRRQPVELVCGERIDAGAMVGRLQEYAMSLPGVTGLEAAYSEMPLGPMGYYVMEFTLTE